MSREDEGLPDARIPAIITVKEEISVVEDTTTPLLQSGTTTPLQTDGSKAPGKCILEKCLEI